MNTLLLMLWYTYIFLQVCFATFLLQPIFLLIIFAVKKVVKPGKKHQELTRNQKNYRFGVIVTAHKDSKFIHPIVDSLLQQTYPCFNVYVVADGCDPATLPRFTDLRIHLLVPPQPMNSNTRSIRYALEHFQPADEVMVIFDPDNLVHNRFLEVLNRYYNKGYEAVQANMLAKNADTLYERIDSVGAIFNNFVDREVRNELNLSVNTWGCGVSVKRAVYEKIRYDQRSTFGGFDKYLQSEIVKSIPRLAYAQEAIFYDEKIGSAESLEKQRSRWIRAYFKFLPDAFGVFFTGIGRRNFNMAYFGYNLIRPPYFLQILVSLLLAGVNLLVAPVLSLGWFIVLALFLLSFTLVILIRKKNRSVLQGFWFAPLFFFHQLRSLLKIGRNKKSILKTDNTKVLYIKDMFGHEDS